MAALLVGGCAATSPYQPPPQPPAASEEVPVQTRPGEPPTTVEEPQPLPPVVREPTLGPASRALVSQAQVQMATKNYAIAAGSVERALRIEPANPLLWIELGRIRQAEGNYVQAENMGRKAASMAINAPRAQSAAWRLIAESYRARGRNSEAQDATEKAEAIARQ